MSRHIFRREVPFSNGLRLQCIDPKISNIAHVLSAVTDTDAIFEALAAADAQEHYDHPFGAVYVLGLDGLDKCKIGFSRNPAKRIRQLKTGLWATPRCFALFWSVEFSAKCIEHSSLRRAKQDGFRLSGEWVNMLGADAADLVLHEALWHHYFCDSAWFVNHWVKSTPVRSNPTKQSQAVSVDDLYRWGADKRIGC